MEQTRILGRRICEPRNAGVFTNTAIHHHPSYDRVFGQVARCSAWRSALLGKLGSQRRRHSLCLDDWAMEQDKKKIRQRVSGGWAGEKQDELRRENVHLNRWRDGWARGKKEQENLETEEEKGGKEMFEVWCWNPLSSAPRNLNFNPFAPIIINIYILYPSRLVIFRPPLCFCAQINFSVAISSPLNLQIRLMSITICPPVISLIFIFAFWRSLFMSSDSSPSSSWAVRLQNSPSTLHPASGLCFDVCAKGLSFGAWASMLGSLVI